MSQQTTHQHAAEQAYPQRWPALWTLLLAGFMNLIDITIVNVALPRLQVSLGATSTEIEWVDATGGQQMRYYSDDYPATRTRVRKR